jgi:hypothetical protein
MQINTTATEQAMSGAVSALLKLPANLQTQANVEAARQAYYDYLTASSKNPVAKAATYGEAVKLLGESAEAALETEGLDAGTKETLQTLLDDIDSEGRAGDNRNIHYGKNEMNVDRDTISKIYAMERGERPDPSTYISQDIIDKHLAQFTGTVTKFAANVPTGTVGPLGGTFVMPKIIANEIIANANGNVGTLEKLLALEPGTLGDNPVRIDVTEPKGLRMPSGNEWGANNKWIPGGYTMEGIIEAIIDPATVGTYVSSNIF